MPIQEQKLGLLGFYKNNLAENLKLLRGSDARQIREDRNVIDQLNGGDVSVSAHLFDAAKHATPQVSEVRHIMDHFRRLYESLEQRGFIGQDAEADLLSGLKDGTSVVALRFMPVDVAEYKGLVSPYSLYQLVRHVIDAPADAAWHFRTS